MRLAAPDLTLEEAGSLRGLFLPDRDEERRLLVLVRSGRVIGGMRTDLGVARGLVPEGSMEDAEAVAGGTPPDRTVVIDVSRPPASLLGGIFSGSVRARPAWVPGAERFRRLPGSVRRGVLLLVPDGAFGLALTDVKHVFGARVRSGRLEAVRGGRSLGGSAPDGAEGLVTLLRRRLATPRFAVLAPEEVVRKILASPRPVTALERAVIRGDAEVATCALRIRLALLLLRLLGL